MIRRPYDEDDLPAYEHVHATVAPSRVEVEALRPTQPTLDLSRLIALHYGDAAEGPDPYPHVVRHDGVLWVHNGHHRWARSLLRGERTMLVRMIDGSTP